MARREYAGGAPQRTLNGGIAASGVTTFNTNGGASGWPGGGTGKFLVVIDKGLATEEKLYCSASTASSLTTSDADRGKDGTSASSHTSGATVNHVGGAIDLDEPNQHINDTTLDQHTQYLNTARHAAVAHTGAMIQDLAVGTVDLSDNAVTYAKLEVGQRWEPGDIKTSFCTSPTTGWLLCDGSLVATATYTALFAAIGHSANGGVDPGSGNFKLPDLRQRFPMGKAASGTGSTLGGTGGSKDAIAVSHGHAHSHGTTVGNENTTLAHAHSGSSSSDGAHNHGPDGQICISNAGATNGLVSPPVEKATFSTLDTDGSHGHTITVGSNGPSAHNHTVTVNSDTTSAGSSGTDANLPGYQVVNYFIKT